MLIEPLPRECHLKRKGIRHKIKRAPISDHNWTDLIDFGKAGVSATVGALVGNVVAGPPGAIGGGIVASGVQVMLNRVVLDERRRKLSNREKFRTEKVLSQFRTKVLQNLSEGKSLRQDGFFSSSIDERSAAEEIFEGVLLAAQSEYQEKKIKFEGNFFANIVFELSIDRASANFLLRLAQTLSYRQLCIIALFVQQEKFPLRNIDYRNVERFDNNSLAALLQEIYGLYSQSLLFIDGEAMVSIFDVIPAKMMVGGPLKSLYFLMDLGEVDQSDINALAEQLAQ
jgi:hypothetical protein